jgi:hypothetical protein
MKGLVMRFIAQLILAFATSCQVPALFAADKSEFAVPAAKDARAVADVNEFLKPLSGRLRPLHSWYKGARLAGRGDFATNQSGEGHGWLWKYSVRATTPDGESDARDLKITFKLQQGAAKSAGVAVGFDFADWSADNYVLIPGSVYNANRNRVVSRAYASGLDRSDLYRKDLPLTTCDLPQLSPTPGAPSSIEVSTCNATTPAICVYNKSAKKAFILLAEQGIRHGRAILDNGLTVEEWPDRSRAMLIVSAPGVRSRKPDFIGFSNSPDRGLDMKAGDEITIRLRTYVFPTPDIPGLLERFMTVRKAVTGENHPRNLIPFSEVARRMTARIDSRFHDGGRFKFYCPENAPWISFGWIGGLIDTFPMLALGDEGHLRRVTETFGFAIPRAQGKSGYFYGLLDQDGHAHGREGYDDHPEISLTRKNGDVLFWMIKQFMLLKAQGRGGAIKPEWERSAKRLADAFEATWKKCGQLGNFLNVETGDVAVYNTTGGAMAVGGLALAAEYFHDPKYRRIAEQAATFYYTRDVIGLGMTTGGCADILQNADSETAAGFMTSLMALYETTGERKWLDMSRTLANLTATWVVSYDYELPPQTELGQLGAKLAGAVWASTQNKHGAPGFCTNSGDPLFKIYRATGDSRYAELIRDVAHAHAEGIRPDGQITERLTYCDADSRGSRGSGSTGWNELNGFLMALELPSIYVRTDEGKVFVFDHILVRDVHRSADCVTVTLSNPTSFPASIAIFGEAAEQAARPLGYTAFVNWPHVELHPGESKQVTVDRLGKIK